MAQPGHQFPLFLSVLVMRTAEPLKGLVPHLIFKRIARRGVAQRDMIQRKSYYFGQNQDVRVEDYKKSR